MRGSDARQSMQGRMRTGENIDIVYGLLRRRRAKLVRGQVCSQTLCQSNDSILSINNYQFKFSF